jgi:hypothetical protein
MQMIDTDVTLLPFCIYLRVLLVYTQRPSRPSTGRTGRRQSSLTSITGTIRNLNHKAFKDLGEHGVLTGEQGVLMGEQGILPVDTLVQVRHERHHGRGCRKRPVSKKNANKT